MATRKRQKEAVGSHPPQRLKAREWSVELRAGVTGTSGQVQTWLDDLLVALRGRGTVASYDERSVSLKFNVKAAKVDEALPKALGAFERAFRRAGLPWTPVVIGAELETVDEMDKPQAIAEAKAGEPKARPHKTC